MARLDEPPTAEPQPPPLRLYDPAAETDPLLQRYVTLPPPGGRNDARLRGLDGSLYPIWAVMLNYRATRGEMNRLMEIYADALAPEHIAAALRFTELYPDEILPKLEDIERAR